MRRYEDLMVTIMDTLCRCAPAAGLTVERLIEKIEGNHENVIVYHIMLLEERGWLKLNRDLFMDVADGRRLTNGQAYVQLADRGHDQLEANQK